LEQSKFLNHSQCGSGALSEKSLDYMSVVPRTLSTLCSTNTHVNVSSLQVEIFLHFHYESNVDSKTIGVLFQNPISKLCLPIHSSVPRLIC